MIATDGVFSMDGIIANLPAICDLADRYDALVMVDDSHASRLHGQDRPRHARASRRDGPDRHPHRHARQSAKRRLGRLHVRAAKRSSTCCGSARGRTCSPIRCRRRSSAAALKSIELLVVVDGMARSAGTEHAWFRGGDDRCRVQYRPGNAPDRADHARRRRRPPEWPSGCSTMASTSSRFRSPWSRRERRGFACRCRPHIHPKISRRPSMHFKRRRKNWGFECVLVKSAVDWP